jgi:hypothetical protein
MNAATFAKSAKGLILASGLIAASSVLAYAQDVTVPLGSQAVSPLSSMYASAPSGMATLGGHTFDLTSGNALFLGNGQSVSYSGSWLNATGAFLLLNSANTYWWYDQTVVGDVTLTFSDGTTQSTNLVVGGNLREWRAGSGFTVDTLSDPAAANVWSGAPADDPSGTAVIDMLTITLPGTKTLTNVTINDTNSWGALALMLAGLTIDPANPTPTPTPSCSLPGNACNTPAAQHSQAPQHANSANFTGTSPSQGKSAHSANAGLNTPASTHQHPVH